MWSSRSATSSLLHSSPTMPRFLGDQPQWEPGEFADSERMDGQMQRAELCSPSHVVYFEEDG